MGGTVCYLPKLQLVGTMGDGTITSHRNCIDVTELVLDGLRIILAIGGLLIRPVCENDGNSDAC